MDTDSDLDSNANMEYDTFEKIGTRTWQRHGKKKISLYFSIINIIFLLKYPI